MDEPGKIANRILLSTGFGLLLISGFGIIEGRLRLTELGLGHLFLTTGFVLLITSRLLTYETTRLSKLFPNESETALKSRINKELSEIKQSHNFGSAWAELESRVLASEIGGESE